MTQQYETARQRMIDYIKSAIYGLMQYRDDVGRDECEDVDEHALTVEVYGHLYEVKKIENDWYFGVTLAPPMFLENGVFVHGRMDLTNHRIEALQVGHEAPYVLSDEEAEAVNWLADHLVMDWSPYGLAHEPGAEEEMQRIAERENAEYAARIAE